MKEEEGIKSSDNIIAKEDIDNIIKDIKKQTEDNQKEILKEEEKMSATKSFDFKKEDVKTKGKEAKEKNKEPLYPEVIFMFFLAFISIILMFGMYFVSNRNVLIEKNEYSVENIEGQNYKYTNSLNDVTFNIKDIEKTDGSLKITYTLINKGKEIQPLFINSYLMDSSNYNLKSMSSYNNMQSRILKGGQYTEGFIVFKTEKESLLNGFYQYTIPFFTSDGEEKISIDFTI